MLYTKYGFFKGFLLRYHVTLELIRVLLFQCLGLHCDSRVTYTMRMYHPPRGVFKFLSEAKINTMVEKNVSELVEVQSLK